jgi:hypothetical protein
MLITFNYLINNSDSRFLTCHSIISLIGCNSGRHELVGPSFTCNCYFQSLSMLGHRMTVADMERHRGVF